MRLLPKLLDERSEIFRYFSCKFRVEQSKVSSARVVVNREFGVVSCFTLEASMFGYIAKDRSIKEITPGLLADNGRDLGLTFQQLMSLSEESLRSKQKLKQKLQLKQMKLTNEGGQNQTGKTSHGSSLGGTSRPKQSQ